MVDFTFYLARLFIIPYYTFYLACLEKIPFNSLIHEVSCTEILCWSFLERINYFSFDLCVCSEFAGLPLVLLGQVPLGLIYIIYNLIGVVFIVWKILDP